MTCPIALAWAEAEIPRRAGSPLGPAPTVRSDFERRRIPNGHRASCHGRSDGLYFASRPVMFALLLALSLAGVPQTKTPTTPLDLNSAPPLVLMQLPGNGEKRALDIVAVRKKR